MEHSFTPVIKSVLQKHYGEQTDEIFEKSLLIQYINQKTKSANRGSKSRASFANLYAIYVIIEDYINNHFDTAGGYGKYEGAQYTNLLRRQRELPFGSRLQNHALNNRMNAEFQKFFPTSDINPIIRNLETNRYWINENLLKLKIKSKSTNIAKAVIEIIDKYVEAKQNSFKRFIEQCEILQDLLPTETTQIHDFVEGLLAPNSDARLFEIVSYAILKLYYKEQNIIWGYDMDNLNVEALKLYKTGRTNANDGGIDFVMKPLGRFFQVTETLDFKKYFLDIEKIERYPITFVVKTTDAEETILEQLKENAVRTYVIESIVDKYMSCIEEIINIPKLIDCFTRVEENKELSDVLNEILLQSKVEFNYDDEE
ncbi:MAG: restriction endonuclease [Candidatus Phocaeicola faecipullorum]|nr:restriction endonuclease [Candidatus Phocaeicola faecipullorum]